MLCAILKVVNLVCDCLCSGTFGQEKEWSLGVPSSYQHPLNSRDLLLHTEATATPIPPPDCGLSGKNEEEAETESSKSKPHSLKLSSVARAVQSALTLTEMEEVTTITQVANMNV